MSAVFSPCGRYRYWLERLIGGSGPPVAFVLHNPSTADAHTEDATSRRSIGYARAWGCSRLIHVNPWAGIATRPTDLWAMADPVGPDNDRHITEATREIVTSGGFVVVAWGVVKPPRHRRAKAAQRLADVEALLRAAGCRLCALSANKDRSPKHPLYLRGGILPRVWPYAFGDKKQMHEVV